MLEECGRRQDDVGERSGIGHDLLVDDNEYVVARQLLDDSALIRRSCNRIAVVDKHTFDRRSARLAERARELAHIHRARLRRGLADRSLRRDGPARVTVRHREAAAAHAELAGDRGQREDRRDGTTAVAVAFDAPAAADHRRRAARVQLDELVELTRFDAGLGGCSRDRPASGTDLQLLDAGRTRGELRITVTAREQRVDHRECDRQIGAWTDRDMEIRASRERSPPWIDHSELGSGFARTLDHGDEMDPGRRRVHAPQHDQLRVLEILERDAGHLAVEAVRGRGGRRRAERATQRRRAEPPKQPRRECALGEPAIGAAVVIRQDRFAAGTRADRTQLVGDKIERLVPRRLAPLPCALRTDPHARREDAVVAVQMVGDLADLAADEDNRAGTRCDALRSAASRNYTGSDMIWPIRSVLLRAITRRRKTRTSSWSCHRRR